MVLTHDNLQWTLDNEHGLIITWYEGFFNKTQKITNKTTIKDPQKLAHELRLMGDWIMANNADLCVCHEMERLNVLQELDNITYWEILATTHFELFVSEDEDPIDTLERLMQHHDYAEYGGLLDIIGCFGDDEINELCDILTLCHKYHSDDPHWAIEIFWLSLNIEYATADI